jgi:hypothetical protein
MRQFRDRFKNLPHSEETNLEAVLNLSGRHLRSKPYLSVQMRPPDQNGKFESSPEALRLVTEGFAIHPALPGFEMLDKDLPSIPAPKAFLRKRGRPVSSYLSGRDGDHSLHRKTGAPTVRG